MKNLYKIAVLGCSFCFALNVLAQEKDSSSNKPLNAVNTIIEKDENGKFSIGAYAQVEYIQEFGDTARHNAILDVHRMVTFMGYRFNERTHFIAEIELEHVNEAAVEQAFLNYRITRWMDLRTGLILIPMGIINEYHEPSTFNGVARPNLDNKIVPATWRELGAGLTGAVDEISVKYQLYAVNGFNGYDGAGKFKGSDGLRGGRQKGIKSFMTSPDFSAKVDYYRIPGLKLGAAGYFGTSESKLYEGLWKEDSLNKTQLKADSSVVGIRMIGLDARYAWKGIEARAQYIIADLSNTEQYNKLTGKDLGSSMKGYFIEAGYDFLSLCKNNKSETELVLFVRYEKYDTHASVTGETKRNDAYNRTDITAGLSFKVAKGAVFKGDFLQSSTEKEGDRAKKYFNLGFGIWF